MVLPVPEPGFRGRFWAGFGRKSRVTGQKYSPELPGPSTRAVWDWSCAPSQYFYGQNRPETDPAQKPGPGTGSITKEPDVSNKSASCTKRYDVWADRREDKMINPASGFWPIFGPLGRTAGPGSPGNGSGSKKSAGCTKHQPRRQIRMFVRRYFVFWGYAAKRQNDKIYMLGPLR